MFACSHAATHKCVGDSGMFNGRPGTPSDVQELFWNRVHGRLHLQLHGSFHLKQCIHNEAAARLIQGSGDGPVDTRQLLKMVYYYGKPTIGL